MKVIETEGALIKAWTNNVPVEQEAMEQVKNLAKLPFIFKHVALMPDVHAGKGSTIGSVIATKGAIVPAAVGVDIGCGMMALKTSLKSTDMPDNLFNLRCEIEAAIPHGRTDNGGKNDKGAWDIVPTESQAAYSLLEYSYKHITEKHPKSAHHRHPSHHLGSLGSGNHFIEICLDQNNGVWLMLHSGSRGVGNRIGTYFIEKAKEEMRRYHIDKFLPDIDLAYLVENTEIYNDYLEAVYWAQLYASVNRKLMMDILIKTIKKNLNFDFNSEMTAINCHHNYVEKENHFNSNVLVTRKGAVRARKTDLGIIPGSMGAKSFIVKGKGNTESFQSCSHGAGRVMSRTKARNIFSLEDHEKFTDGVECRKDKDVIDETPAAYKNIDDVMLAQADLIEVLYILKQILCVKG